MKSRAPNERHLGLYLKERRLACGLSQGKLAQVLKLRSGQWVSNIERGLSPLPLKCLPKLIELLGLEEEEVFDFLVTALRKKFRAALKRKSNYTISAELRKTALGDSRVR